MTLQVPFSVNLATNAQHHKTFLQTLHSLGVTLETPSSDSLRRYRDLWLPLVQNHNSNDNVVLIPPPDVAWLWHCHRLAPAHYAKYCREAFDGTVLEAQPAFALQTKEGSVLPGTATASMDDNQANHGAFPSLGSQTRSIWTRAYPSEPFFLFDDGIVDTSGKDDDEEENMFKDDNTITQTTLIAGFDLVGSTERQALFLWQVSGERFHDDAFLEEAVDKYHKFIQLKPKAAINRSIIVPTYQIDLMWHTHILSSIGLYEKDCKAIMGSTMHHDDSFTDRTEGGILDVSFQSTCAMWKTEYGEDYIVEGGMYRGEPPEEFHRKGWDPDEDLYAMVGNLRMIGKMGASSTFQSKGEDDSNQEEIPIVWASVFGRTSDGQRSFIPTNTKYRRELIKLKRVKDYVLGKPSINGEAGYYHLETKEAHKIIGARVKLHIKRTKTDIAQLECCCGSKADIARKEKKLRDQEAVLAVVEERLQSKGPSRKITKNKDRDTGDHQYYGTSGAWLYPPIFWEGAGGACGGAVVCSGAACTAGAAACGGGGCGSGAAGGCGAGGCGSGGCGGGG